MKKGMKKLALLTLCAVLATPSLALAQDASSVSVFRKSPSEPRVTVDKPQKEIYGGMIPGKRDEVEHIQNRAKRTNQLNWIGFSAELTRTRIFIQTMAPAEYDMSRSEDGTQIILTFSNIKVENTNVLRFIDATYYKRSVKRIDATRNRRAKTVTITLTIEPGSSPQIDTRGNYIYIDFPHTPDEEETSSEGA